MADDSIMVKQVIDAHRALAAAGQTDLIWGHIGIRDPEGRGVWTKASGWGMEEVGYSQVLLVSFDGEVLIGEGKRHIEVFIHTEVMRSRPDVSATVHSHAADAAAFASLDVRLRALTHAATPFLNDDVPRFTGTGNLISTAELGGALTNALGGGNGCLIPGHGLLAVGSSPAAAVMHAVLLNNACAAHLTALAAGGPKRWSSDEEVAAKRDGLWPPSALQSAFDYLVRRADGLYQ